MLHLALLALSAAPSRPPSDILDLAVFTPSGPVVVRLRIRIDGASFRSRFDALMRSVFDELDRDRDGLLSKAEQARAPALGGAEGMPPPAGRATRAWMEEWYARRGVAPFKLIHNADPQGNGRTPAAITRRLLAILDKDGDSLLDAKELAAAERVLLRHDADEDEMIGVGELLDEAPQPNVVLFDGLAGGTMRDFIPLIAERDRREAAKLAKEMGKPLDLGRPIAEAVVEMGRKGVTVAIMAKGEGVSAKGDTLLIGSMSLRLGGPKAGNVLFQLAQAEDAEQAKQFVQQADADKNGYVDRKEAARHPYFASRFDAIDADGDGMVHEKEVKAHLVKERALSARANAATVALTVSESGAGLFDLLDTDGDGRLSLREMRAAPALLKRMGKAKLSASDVPRRYDGGFGPGGTANPFGGFGFVVVVDADIVGRGARPARAKKGPEWFRRMDRNGDGDVSPAEWLGTKEEFDAIDTDKDGLLSVPEAEAWDKRKKR
ncbi:MAG: hypothetical protein K2W96_15820 [Gemmataceae bacterium]|nr:hypothetical protein [Gemmataceae bacterium]